MKSNMNLQDVFLNLARKEKVHVSIFLVGGFQLKGTIHGFDNYTIILENDGKQSLVYKAAVSSIVPARPLDNILAQNSDN